MKIAVASGKGGTGKTMVATSLAASLAPDFNICFLDCDVEAPNAHLFLKPDIDRALPAVIQLPDIDRACCTLCGRCTQVCEYNALAKIGTTIMVFPQLCHGCGSCTRLCPEEAIREVPRQIGTISRGKTADGSAYGMGELSISEPMPTPVINQLKSAFSDDDADLTIIDSPPGASCSVVAAVHDADFVLLVTEPTPFGWHDLKQMLGVLSQTGTPAGVIVNREGIGDTPIENNLSKHGIPILLKIPFQVEIAEGLAAGKLLTDILPEYKTRVTDLFQNIRNRLNQTEGQK
jgi:MinD superfamily P-loop ATPase